MLWETPIDELPATHSTTIKRLKAIGIHTYGDFISYIPSRYENYSLNSKIANLQPGETVTVRGVIQEAKNVYARNRLTIQRVTLQDETGELELTWFNQPYLMQMFKTGATLSVAGEVKQFRGGKSLDVKEYEILKSPDQPTIHTGRRVAVYPERYGLSARLIRDKMRYVLEGLRQDPDSVPDWLPAPLKKEFELINLGDAYLAMHLGDNEEEVKTARKRLAFDELYVIQLSNAIIKQKWQEEEVSYPFFIDGIQKHKIESFTASLPYELTAAQKRVTEEILADLAKPNPMNRFLQGDVGSGKTVVAAIAAYTAYLNGFQSIIMAPTEILAQQHYETLTKLLEPHGITIALLTGSTKKEVRSQISEVSNPHIVVGTHALFTKKSSFKNVGLVVIDEQHRFGVAQRAELKKKGTNPHLLTMTATPIPRTMALTIYNELDMSIIDEMPKGRLKVKTFLVPEEKRASGYEWIKKQIKEHGDQVFIICPLIEESTHETMKTVKAANKEYELLRKKVFPLYKMALLHGRMKSAEKEDTMRRFKNKEFDILVSTSVVEVGVDIPNATIIMIEGAERYGLAQLHQLRGRVGRSTKQSYCMLFTSNGNGTNDRLQYFAANSEGIKLAEYDLEHRGAGDIYGMRQSGYNDLRVAKLTDYVLISLVKKAVEKTLKNKWDAKPQVKARIYKARPDLVTRD